MNGGSLRIIQYSISSNRKIAHLPHCKVLRRIPPENLRSFDNLKDAQKHGYRLCNCCSRVADQYRKERSLIGDFCKKHGFTYKLQDGIIHIISKYDCWRIIVNPDNLQLSLYHKNTSRRNIKSNNPGVIPGFHHQAYRANTIIKYLQYIADHDCYRDNYPFTQQKSAIKEKAVIIPEWIKEKYGEDYISMIEAPHNRVKGTKKYRRMQKRKKRQEYLHSISRVDALLEELKIIGHYREDISC